MNTIPVLISEEKLYERTCQLGEQISTDYKDKNLLLVAILKGSVVFLCDLMRKITACNCKIDFMCVSSYNNSTVSSGNVSIVKDLTIDIENYDVLIVEDIIDSGITLSKVCRMLRSRNPKSLKVCTLLDKPQKRVVDFTPDYTGFQIDDLFVVGYGLDYAEKYRNLSYVGFLTEDML